MIDDSDDGFDVFPVLQFGVLCLEDMVFPSRLVSDEDKQDYHSSSETRRSVKNR